MPEARFTRNLFRTFHRNDSGSRTIDKDTFGFGGRAVTRAGSDSRYAPSLSALTCSRSSQFNLLFIPFGDYLKRAGEPRARAGAIGLANQTFAFHLIEHGRGPAIADSQPALQHRSRRPLHIHDDAKSVFEQFVALAARVFETHGFFVGLRNGFVVIRLPLRFDV